MTRVVNDTMMDKPQIQKRKLSKRIRAGGNLYLMLLPAILYYVIFRYGPMYGVQIAFKEYNFREGIWGSKWIGLENFSMLFSNSVFQSVIKNTLVISFGRILFTFFVPILVAMLMNELRSERFKKGVQTAMYLPHFLSWVIIAGIAYSMFTIDGGFINKIILSFGGQPINFLLDSNSFLPVIYSVGVWKEVGWETIIYIAALSGIDPGFYEAATVDGANRLQKMKYITWPGIKSTVVIMLILTVSRVMYAGMEQIINMYSAPVYDVADIIDTYVYRELLMKSEFGMGTAAGLFQSVINLFLVIIVNKIAKQVNDGEALF